MLKKRHKDGFTEEDDGIFGIGRADVPLDIIVIHGKNEFFTSPLIAYKIVIFGKAVKQALPDHDLR